ncbi:hypothetical protein P152DRAFT_187505 [Eremomyces bilateralis CBS 781.70]|uniref:F-box domain-containing protein n=1 Tax=Eremomyces bilateralis CBS 781.70 TaxID=1392243 RepID=A0A6G1GC86_9PEZI|nr:uncharacterized protein P152DRAFT_187505 [Eremomyces bilateralis CBS 781.70]KAF1815511.1 hypothetical protein P152DRAFT_187505 [Eremomyces bilateralis CBS 781.70]
MDSPSKLKLLDLPVDVLLLIFPYLDAKSFLSLCATCKALQSPEIIDDAPYWSSATRTTFRVPNQPVIEHDGRRWRRLYQRMFTQSRVFTWGSNGTGGLGHVNELTDPNQLSLSVARGRRQMRYGGTRDAHYPREMDKTRKLGIIADVQCGGWSTTLLNDKGRLFTAGEIDGERRLSVMRGASTDLRPLKFPFEEEGEEKYVPRRAIRQFSAGRKHILGLADSGATWCWSELNNNPVEIRFLFDVAMDPTGKGLDTRRHGAVRKVVAGWDKSAALISGLGIKCWDIRRQPGDGETVDARLVPDECTVPETQFQRPEKGRANDSPWPELADTVGEVLNFILLEGYLVFITDLKKIFVAKLEGNPTNVSRIIEIPALSHPEDSDVPSAKHLQGSFRTLGVILENGEVLVAENVLLEIYWDNSIRLLNLHPPFSNLPQPTRPASLQKQNVISLAFADYHYLALHASGAITPHGAEPQGTGALGLGPLAPPTGPALLRGLIPSRPRQFRSNVILAPPSNSLSRKIWFDAPRQRWLEFMNNGATDPDTSAARAPWTNIMPLPNATTEAQQRAFRTIGAVSDWVEAAGERILRWALGNAGAGKGTAEEDGLAMHFSLAVSAGGWHSAALVLVNEEQERHEYARCVVEDPDYYRRYPASPESSAPTASKGGGRAEGSSAGSDTENATAAARRWDGHSEGDSDNDEDDARDTTRFPEPGKKYVWADDPFPVFPAREGRLTGETAEVELPAWLRGE